MWIYAGFAMKNKQIWIGPLVWPIYVAAALIFCHQLIHLHQQLQFQYRHLQITNRPFSFISSSSNPLPASSGSLSTFPFPSSSCGLSTTSKGRYSTKSRLLILMATSINVSRILKNTGNSFHLSFKKNFLYSFTSYDLFC